MASPPYRKLTQWAMPPAITQCSRQIRQETVPIYYGANQFITYSEIIRGSHDSSLIAEIGHPTAMKWLKAIGPENTRFLQDIRVRFPSFYTDACPAMRFIAHASRIGIALPKGSVTGFVNEWINMDKFSYYHDRPRRVWRVVDETNVVYHNAYDALYGKHHCERRTCICRG